MRSTGLGVDSFRATFPSADFAAGVVITVDAIIYPWCGPSYQLSVNGNAAPNMKNSVIRGYRVTPVYCYVSASGNNATGVASTDPATAAANPCLTINGAAVKIRAANNSLFARDEIGGGVIRFPVGTWVVDSTGTGEVPVTTACVVYESINPADKAVTILTDNGTIYGSRNIAQRALLRNLTLRKTGDACTLFRSTGAVTTSLVFDNCDFDANGQSVRTYWINFCGRMWVRDCRNANGSVGLLSPNGTDPKNAVSIGSTTSGSALISQIACRVASISLTTVTAVTLGFAQGMVVNCVVSGNSVSGFQMTMEGAFLATPGLGYAVTGTVIESYGSGQGAVRMWADGNADDVQDFLYLNNTTPGLNDQTRFNRFYNDEGTVARNKAVTLKFNAISSSGCKTDTFGTPPNGSRIGNWPVVMGVSHAYNHLLRNVLAMPNGAAGAGSWHVEMYYPGLRIGTGAGADLDAQWTLDASASGTGAGGGDYRPQAGSPLRRVPAGMTIAARDMLGQTIPADGSAFVGALQAT